MRRSIAFAALVAAILAGTASAQAAETARDRLVKKAAKVASKGKLCTCDDAQDAGRLGELTIYTAGNAPTAKCTVWLYDAFGNVNGGMSCPFFTVLP